jgi:hypothetical protein
MGGILSTPAPASVVETEGSDESSSNAQESDPTAEADMRERLIMSGVNRRKVAKRTMSQPETSNALPEEEEHLQSVKKQNVQRESTIVASMPLPEDKEEGVGMLSPLVAASPHAATYPLNASLGSAWSYSTSDWKETRTSARKTQIPKETSLVVETYHSRRKRIQKLRGERTRKMTSWTIQKRRRRRIQMRKRKIYRGER